MVGAILCSWDSMPEPYKNSPKAQHFVPCSTLERFTDPSGFLHVYDKASATHRRQRPKEVMHIRNYYTQEWTPAGVDPYVFERCLGEWLEDAAKHVIDHLEASCELTAQELADFLVYLELQRIRVPRQAKAAMALMRETILRGAPADIVADIQAGLFELTMNKSARFDYMRMMVRQFSPWFARMEWEVTEAEEGSAFVMTDSPVSFYNAGCPPPAEAGIGLTGTLVLFPLSSRYLLVMRHPEYRNNPNMSRLDVLPDPILGEDRWVHPTRTVSSVSQVIKHNWIMSQLADRLVVGESNEVLAPALPDYVNVLRSQAKNC